MKLNDLEKRVIDLSYQHNLSHIGSCLTAVNIIDHIYNTKKRDEKFILSSGHAHVAHLVVMEKYGLIKDINKLIRENGIHCDRQAGCDVSTGSLGHGIGIAVGLALADRTKDVYVLVSDGELAEGSCWEALNIASKFRLENLRVAVNTNGFTAYDTVEPELLDVRLQYFFPSLVIRTNMYQYPPYLQGLNAHYHVLTKEEYEADFR